MDVNRTIKSAETLNGGKKLAPSIGWNAALNQAGGVKKTLDLMSKTGIAKPDTLEFAKVSELPIAQMRDAFARALTAASDNRKPLDDEQKAGLEKSSATLVNQFFIGSMLKQMRQSPFKVDSLSGGKGGTAYAGLFDQNVAEHAGNRIAKSLVKSMVNQYSRTAAGVTAASGIAS